MATGGVLGVLLGGQRQRPFLRKGSCPSGPPPEFALPPLALPAPPSLCCPPCPSGPPTPRACAAPPLALSCWSGQGAEWSRSRALVVLSRHSVRPLSIFLRVSHFKETCLEDVFLTS